MLDRFERFSTLMFEVSRCWHKLATDELSNYDLSSAHAVYLTTLYRYPEGLTAARLAELCARDKSDVSRMVGIMEKKGLVVRRKVGNNLYRALLQLTERGNEAAAHVCNRAATAVELAGGGVDDKHREIFYDVLQTICGNLQQLSRDGLPYTQSDKE